METPEDLIDEYLQGSIIDPDQHDTYCLEKLAEYLGDEAEY